MKLPSTVAAALSLIAIAFFGLVGTAAAEDKQTALPDATTPCDQSGATQRFLEWSDELFYVPAANGSFETGAPGWELSNGASVTAGGNDHGSAGHSLRIEAGATALSPPVCVGLGYSHARMFASTGTPGAEDAKLKVLVIYTHPKGGKQQVKSVNSVLPAVAGWDPTKPWKMPDEKALGTDTDTAEVQFLFSALPGSDWLIDDIYVDPRMRN